MKAPIFACIVAGFCIAASVQDTEHFQCDDGPLPLRLNVQGCESSPCNFYRGVDLIAEWDFTANVDTKSLKPRVKATALGITVDYPFPEQDACKSLSSGKCPLKKNDKATYDLKMLIDEALPSVMVTIEFALIGDNNNVHVCFKLDGKVVDK